YHIFSKSINSIGFEAVILEVEPDSKREKVITDAWEFKYIIKGSVTYIIDDVEVVVNEGDSLCFNGRLPHVPENRTQENCIMLVLYFYSESNS
ncbi:MAG: cupin domain-containing protein, partial [Flavobacterium sp.]